MASFIGISSALTVSVVLWAAPVSAVFTPESLGSGLSILTHNDLYGNSSSRQSAVIVLDTPQAQNRSQQICSALGESLWNPEPAGNVTGGLDFLPYLDYNKVTDDVGTYHVAGRNDTCRAITTDGRLQTIDCRTTLPALCSQSAVLSAPTWSDTASRWHTAVNTGKQTVVGYRDKLSFRFLGIRYARRPKRFGHTKYDAAPELDIALAHAYGPQCIQSGCTAATCAEDCHSLNIWTPYLPSKRNSASGKLKAVMVWIHGGGFTSGTASDPTFDGGNLASRGDVVVVTINYRLGTLGFLALDGTSVTGNYGIVDQLTALEWLRNHIKDFGGDPDKITIYGQSAGAASVRALLSIMSTRSDIPKVAGAIMMSNPDGLVYASTFSHYRTLPEAGLLNRGILNETGCSNTTDQSIQLACLRALDPLKLVSSRTIARYPVIDGTYIKSDLRLDNAARPLDIPILMGIMRDDGAPFSKLMATTDVTEALDMLSFNSSQIVDSKKFPIPNTGNRIMDVFNVTSRVTTDAEFRCLGQSTAASAVRNAVFPRVYSYEIHRGYQIVEWSPNPPTCLAPVTETHPYGDPSQEYYKCHSGELYYVFGTLIRQGRIPRDDFDIPFSQYLVDTWTAFARTQDPSPDAVFLSSRGFSNTTAVVRAIGSWKPSSAEKPMVRVLDTVVKDVGFTELEQCEVLGLPLEYHSRQSYL